MNTKEKKGKQTGLMLLLALLVYMAVPMTAYAMDFNAKVNELKVKFPQGKYWNHVGSTVDSADSVTDTPCTCHGVAGVSHVEGTGGCVCNHFINSHGGKSTQCMGFAYKLGYEIFGETGWTTVNSNIVVSNIRVGDIVRHQVSYAGGGTGEHSALVVALSGTTATLAEANYSGKCQISWTRTIDLATTTIYYYERANNYDTVITGGTTSSGGGSTTTPGDSSSTSDNSAQPPSDYTGWKQAEDGVHTYYMENGTIQKDKWLTLTGYTYYLDSNGYRVMGFYTIGGKKYYFNSDGVLLTKQWVCVNGEDYYVNEDGLVLLSQWLYHGNLLVYVTGDGSVAKSEIVKIGKYKYFFNADGSRSKGFKNVDGDYYYTNKKGIIQKKKWIIKGKKRYWLKKSGKRAESEMVKINGYRYYFNSKGRMVRSKKITYNDKVYRANTYGVCTFLYYED